MMRNLEDAIPELSFLKCILCIDLEQDVFLFEVSGSDIIVAKDI